MTHLTAGVYHQYCRPSPQQHQTDLQNKTVIFGVCALMCVCLGMYRFVDVLSGVITFLLHALLQKVDPEFQVEVLLLQRCDLLMREKKHTNTTNQGNVVLAQIMPLANHD